MKLIKFKDAEQIKIATNCISVEYDFNEREIDLSTCKINGRYPQNGYCVNTIVKELALCEEGEGCLCLETEKVPFKKGDAVLIEVGEKYFWEGNFKLVITCSPAWTPDQHKIID